MFLDSDKKSSNLRCSSMTRFGHKLNYVINTFVKHTHGHDLAQGIAKCHLSLVETYPWSKFWKIEPDLLSRIFILFRIHVWLRCSIPRGCFCNKLCESAGAGSCTLESVVSIINWYWKQEQSWQKWTGFCTPQIAVFLCCGKLQCV